MSGGCIHLGLWSSAVLWQAEQQNGPFWVHISGLTYWAVVRDPMRQHIVFFLFVFSDFDTLLFGIWYISPKIFLYMQWPFEDRQFTIGMYRTPHYLYDTLKGGPNQTRKPNILLILHILVIFFSPQIFRFTQFKHKQALFSAIWPFTLTSWPFKGPEPHFCLRIILKIQQKWALLALISKIYQIIWYFI